MHARSRGLERERMGSVAVRDYRPAPRQILRSMGTSTSAPLPDSTAVEVLRPWLLLGAWLSCAAVLLGQWLIPDVLTRLQYVPFAVSLLLFGLPHGALDHLVVRWLRGERATARRVLPFVGIYLLPVVAYLALWQWLPVLALALFLLISLLHWGDGDHYFLATFLGRPAPRSARETGVIWLVRGGLPIALPVLTNPAGFPTVAGGVLAHFGAAGTWQIDPALRIAGLLALGTLLALYALQAAVAFRTAGGYALRTDLGEVALLVALFWLVPSVLAVGVYFCLWHSTRHIARLLLIDPRTLPLLRRRQVGRALLAFAADALPATLGALALLAALFVLHARTLHAIDSVVFLYLALIAALTLPHALLVLWMDRVQGLWGTSR